MTTLNIFGIRFSFKYFVEFLSNYKDIFFLKTYYFKAKTRTPFIIDCGSHIGISVLYFKTIYPNSDILCFEANPTLVKLLKINVSQNHMRGVRIIHAAVGDKDGRIDFYSAKDSLKYNLGDSTVKNFWYNTTNYTTIKIPSKRLSSYITRPVDLLNLDIEGAEGVVLKEIEKKLPLINEIFLEYHGNDSNHKNDLHEILDLLGKYKFTYTIRDPATLFHPIRKPLAIHEIRDTDKSFFIIKAKKITI